MFARAYGPGSVCLGVLGLHSFCLFSCLLSSVGSSRLHSFFPLSVTQLIKRKKPTLSTNLEVNCLLTTSVTRKQLPTASRRSEALRPYSF